MKYSVALALALATTWLLWSGHYDALLLSFGALSVGLTVWLSNRMRIVDEEGVPLSVHSLRLATYIPWLLWQVVLSNLDVARRIWARDPSSVIAPRLLSVRPVQHTWVAQVLYANSITLTPGTVSVRMYDGEILVHALHRGTADDVTSGEMNRRVAELERKAS